MQVIKINDTTDVIINNNTSKDQYFDSLSPLQQVEYMERVNRLYHMERSKRNFLRNRNIKH